MSLTLLFPWLFTDDAPVVTVSPCPCVHLTVADPPSALFRCRGAHASLDVEAPASVALSVAWPRRVRVEGCEC